MLFQAISPLVAITPQPAVIHWALSQTKEEQLGTKLMDNIMRWLDGSKTPTFNQIDEFSRKANIPLGYFFYRLLQWKKDYRKTLKENKESSGGNYYNTMDMQKQRLKKNRRKI